MNKVKTAFRLYANDKILQNQCVQLYKTNYPQVTDDDETIRLDLLNALYGYYYSKMSYVPFKTWEDMIPKEGDAAQKFYNFIMADENTI